MIAGILVPSGLLIIFNLMIFVLILHRLCNRPSSSLAAENMIKRAIQHTRTIVPISLILGLTWVTGFFAIEEASIVFQYVFCGLNSFLGLFIFLWFIVRQKAARKAWYKLLIGRRCSGRNGVYSSSGQPRSTDNS